MKSDSQIQKDVQQELANDPSISHEHIGAEVLMIRTMAETQS